MGQHFDVVVVGAGAAGSLAAGLAAEQGASVLLLDRNAKIGRKLMITGKGRCNVTNNCDRDRFLQAVRRNPRFLYSAFDAFPPQAVMQFFESLGVPLKTERGSRVFPASDRAGDIVDALRRFIREKGVVFRQNRVMELLAADGEIRGVVTADGSRLSAGAVLLATGGLSYPLTGSTGDGYRLAAAVGHSLEAPRASLTALELRDGWCVDLMGLSLKNVRLSLREKNKVLYTAIGELMFTHFGVSGPLVLSASSYFDGSAEAYRLSIDFKPGLDAQKLDARLLRDWQDAKNRAFKNSLDRLLPRSLVPVVVSRSGIPGDRQVNSITREQRAGLVSLLKDFELPVKGLRPVEEAVVTRGGVKTTEVHPKTMESKCLRGLYFAGEILDLDAVTGGFNLQIAFSTAALAGRAMAAACRDRKKGREIDDGSTGFHCD